MEDIQLSKELGFYIVVCEFFQIRHVQYFTYIRLLLEPYFCTNVNPGMGNPVRCVLLLTREAEGRSGEEVRECAELCLL